MPFNAAPISLDGKTRAEPQTSGTRFRTTPYQGVLARTGGRRVAEVSKLGTDAKLLVHAIDIVSFELSCHCVPRLWRWRAKSMLSERWRKDVGRSLMGR